MSSKRFNEGTLEWYMFKEYWRLCQKFWIPEDNDEYWDNAIKIIGEFMDKYSDEPFSKDLGIAFVENIEKKHRASKK